MHRTRYYRNPAMYYPRSETGYGQSLSQAARSTYKRNSTTPFSPSVKRPNTVYATKHPTYSNPRFVDQSKYVWTANKQQQSSQTTSSSTSTQTQVTAAQPSTAPRLTPTTPSAPSVPRLTPTTPSASSVPRLTPTAPSAPSTMPSASSAPHSVPSATQPTHTRIVSAVKKTPARTAVLHNNGSFTRRELSYLNVTALDTPNAVAVDIASKLREDKFYVIKTVVDVLGVKKAIKLFYETRERELKGGILIQNGRRRRTPGGAYLALLRESIFIPKQEADKVFLEIKRFESRLNKNPHFMKF